MNRLKSLDPPHKGLRNALGKLSLLAGKTDYTTLESVEKLKSLAQEVFHLLKDHTSVENKFILAPLQEKNPAFTESYFAEHLQIEEAEKNLFERFTSLNGKQSNDDGHQLYLDFCKFQSHYLEHINEEDEVVELEMQQQFTDEELMQHQIAIMGEMSFDTLLLWFKYIVPARRAAENAQVLSGFKSAAPQEAFTAVLDTIQKEIGVKEFQEIMSLVN
jgi:glutaredoxin